MAVLPKSPEKNLMGDGITDGLDIIATGLSQGKLFVSNSQAGGTHFPPKRLLNHEMPEIFSFRSTECCYTRAQVPNTVSMDYLFIEMDRNGDPVSQDLLFETWDMPLPIPQLTAKAKGNKVKVEIQKDAFFEEGKTIFSIDDPTVNIVSSSLVDNRSTVVEFDSNDLVRKVLSFEMKSLFYWHAGEATIE